MASSASMGEDEDRKARLRNVQKSSVTPRAVSLRQEDQKKNAKKNLNVPKEVVMCCLIIETVRLWLVHVVQLYTAYLPELLPCASNTEFCYHVRLFLIYPKQVRLN